MILLVILLFGIPQAVSINSFLPPVWESRIAILAWLGVLFFCSGFGYDPKSEDYKAVRFLENYFEDDKELAVDDYQVELYSLNSDSWKPISYSPQARPMFDQSIYIDGFYFWVACDNSDKFLIISFNFSDEEFSVYPVPYCYVWGTHGAQLIEFDGSLAVVTYPVMGTDKPFDIWVWNGEYWTKKFSTEPLQGVELVLGFSKNGKHMFLEGSNHQFLHYDLEAKELKDTGIRDYQLARMQLIHYVESSTHPSGKSLVKKRKLHKEVKDKSRTERLAGGSRANEQAVVDA